MSSKKAFNKNHVGNLQRQALESSRETGSKQQYMSELPESAYLRSVLSGKVSDEGEPLRSTIMERSGQNTPSVISDEDEGEPRPKDAALMKFSSQSSVIRLNSYIVKPRVVSAVSRKGIFKDSYTGGSNMQMTKIGYPLAMPPRLPSIRAGEIIITKRKKTGCNSCPVK